MKRGAKLGSKQANGRVHDGFGIRKFVGGYSFVEGVAPKVFILTTAEKRAINACAQRRNISTVQRTGTTTVRGVVFK